jgi:hypothetical protein
MTMKRQKVRPLDLFSWKWRGRSVTSVLNDSGQCHCGRNNFYKDDKSVFLGSIQSIQTKIMLYFPHLSQLPTIKEHHDHHEAEALE